jgi:hypothetical protein
MLVANVSQVLVFALHLEDTVIADVFLTENTARKSIRSSSLEGLAQNSSERKRRSRAYHAGTTSRGHGIVRQFRCQKITVRPASYLQGIVQIFRFQAPATAFLASWALVEESPASGPCPHGDSGSQEAACKKCVSPHIIPCPLPSGTFRRVIG